MNIKLLEEWPLYTLVIPTQKVILQRFWNPHIVLSCDTVCTHHFEYFVLDFQTILARPNEY